MSGLRRGWGLWILDWRVIVVVLLIEMYVVWFLGG